MGKDVIIACDFNSKAEVIAFLEKFKDEKPFVKIGMELFYAEDVYKRQSLMRVWMPLTTERP